MAVFVVRREWVVVVARAQRAAVRGRGDRQGGAHDLAWPGGPEEARGTASDKACVRCMQTRRRQKGEGKEDSVSGATTSRLWGVSSAADAAAAAESNETSVEVAQIWFDTELPAMSKAECLSAR